MTVGFQILVVAKVSLVLAFTAAVVRIFRSRSAALRSSIWLIGLLALPAMPLLPSVVPAWTIPMIPLPETAQVTSLLRAGPSPPDYAPAATPPAVEPPGNGGVVPTPGMTAEGDRSGPGPDVPWGALTLSLWLAGAAVVGATSPAAVAALKGGRVAVVDFGLRRVTGVGPEGTVLETAIVEGFPLGMHGAPDGSGFWLIQTDFRTGATFSYWDAETLEPTPVTPDLSGMGFEESDLPFEFLAAAAAPGGRLGVGAGERAYRIRVIGLDGGRLYDATREIPRVPKSPETIEEEQASRTAALGQLMDRVGAAASNPEAGALAREVEIDPLYRHFLVHDLDFDEADRLWVRTPRGGTERTVFDVFDARGRHLGEVAIPGRVARFSVGHGYLAAVTLDRLDVQTVEVWRVGPPGDSDLVDTELV